MNFNDIHQSQFVTKLFDVTLMYSSTDKKVSFHFIDAKPNRVFRSITSLGNLVKNVFSDLFLEIALHRCTSFEPLFSNKQVGLNLILRALIPYREHIRKHCHDCYVMKNHSVVNAMELLVLNNRNEPTLAVDLNVYHKNQQMRMIGCSKYNHSNTLQVYTTPPFENQHNDKFAIVLTKSLITHIAMESIDFFTEKDELITLVNNDIYSTKISVFDNRIQKKLNFTARTHNPLGSKNENLRYQSIFDRFVNHLLNSDPLHTGTVLSCVNGNLNPHILFYNIGGNYRYCMKISGHHRRNTCAIMINTTTQMYTIRCKDPECDNGRLKWQKIKMSEIQ